MLTMSCTAELRLDQALDRRYRWPARFAGFEATAHFDPGAHPSSVRPAGAVDAVVRVPTVGAVQLRATDGRPDLLAAVGDLVDGVRRPSVLQACLPWPKEREVLKAGRGELLRVSDPARTTLRLTDGQLAEVHRDRGEHRVAWRIDRWHRAPDGRVVPASMLVSVDDRFTGRPLWFDRVNDEYEPLDGVLVPTRRRVVRWIDHRRCTSELRLLVPLPVR